MAQNPTDSIPPDVVFELQEISGLLNGTGPLDLFAIVQASERLVACAQTLVHCLGLRTLFLLSAEALRLLDMAVNNAQAHINVTLVAGNFFEYFCF